MEARHRESQALSKAHVITVSDGVFNGRREDKSGPTLVTLLRRGGFETGDPEVVPDEVERIAEAIETAVTRGAVIVVTTGGTGLGPRDVTPQATAALIEYEVPGIAEEMRRVGLASTPMAALSRGLAGKRGQALVINVPGSPHGATESLEAVMPMLGHAVNLLHGDTAH
jgi:molybdenum cofactor synthesis domain-containing protein